MQPQTPQELPAAYRTVAAAAEDEFTEKRSRFIGAVQPVSTEEEAQALSVPAQSSIGMRGTMCMPMSCSAVRCAAFPMMGSRRALPECRCWMCCVRRI